MIKVSSHFSMRFWLTAGGLALLAAGVAFWIARATAPVRSPASPSGEPMLPKLLELTEEPTGQVQVKVIPAIEGRARLKVQSDRPTQWLDSAASGPMTLKKADAPQLRHLAIKRKNAKERVKVSVELVYEDDEGNPTLSVQQELTLGGDLATSETTSPPSATVSGTARDGVPVQARVPADAPAPRVVEDRQ